MHSRTPNLHAFQDSGGLGWWCLASQEQGAPAAPVPHSPLGLLVAQPVRCRKATAYISTAHHPQATCIHLSISVSTGPRRGAFLRVLPLFPSGPQVPARRITLCLLPAPPATPSELESSPFPIPDITSPPRPPLPHQVLLPSHIVGSQNASRTLRMKIHADHQNENKQRLFIQNLLWHRSQSPSFVLDRDSKADFIVENREGFR